MPRCAAVLGLLLTAPVFAFADVAPAPPLVMRVNTVDAIVVGRVVGLEDKDIEAALVPGQPKLTYRIAIVNVTDPLKGAKVPKQIRVGYYPNSKRGNKLAAGDDGLFFLTQHPTEPFYLVYGFYDFQSSKFQNFDKDVAEIKKLAKLLEDPRASLKSKNADDRFATAALLVSAYTHRPLGAAKVKQVPIDAEESKLILQALLDADWTKKFENYGMPGPLFVFHQLQLTKETGFTPAAGSTPEHYAAGVRQWLMQNVGTYRVQRFVADEGK
jgi:hypothetical protein